MSTVVAYSLVFDQAFHLQRDLQRQRFDKVTFQIVAPVDLIVLSARDRSCGFNPLFNLLLRALWRIEFCEI